MKKLVCITACFFALLTAQAQLPNGSDAPDFTVTDINGSTHTLSDYLAQGKTVIMDISATWCGPCWNYHESGALEDLYYTYGPAGSDEVVILFIEGDSNTSVESLYGTNVPGDSGVTAGDWTAHSPYPVIDSAPVAQLYEITYYPTIFRICPDGKVNVLQQLNFEGLKENINANCQTLTTLENHALTAIPNYTVCEGSSIEPVVTITNYGTAAITNASIEIRSGSSVLATKSYTGALAMFDDTTVLFDSLEINPGTNYEAVVTSINGAVPGNSQTATDFFNVHETLEGYNNITVKVHTNYYPGDISWAIKNNSGSIVASGGPYQAGNDDFFGGGGQDAETIKIHEETLPATGLECYSVEFYSSTNLGWIGGETQHGIEILSAGQTIFSQFVGNFGSALSVPAAFKTSGMLSNPMQETSTFTIFPNPTTGILNFTTKQDVDVTITDMTGKIVYTARGIQNGSNIDLSPLQKGMYIALISSQNTQSTQKIILN